MNLPVQAVSGIPRSARTSRHAAIASRAFSRASDRVLPWLTQPGIAGHSAIHVPSSSRATDGVRSVAEALPGTSGLRKRRFIFRESAAPTRLHRPQTPQSLPGSSADSRRSSSCCSYPTAARSLSADGHAARSSHSSRSPSRRCSSLHPSPASRLTSHQPRPAQYHQHGPSPDKDSPTARRAPVIDSRRRAASRGNGVGCSAPGVCCVSETGADIFFGKIGKVTEDILVRHARSEILEHIMHGDAQTADARLARALARFDCDDLRVVHWSFGRLTLPQLPRKPDSAVSVQRTPPHSSQGSRWNSSLVTRLVAAATYLAKPRFSSLHPEAA